MSFQNIPNVKVVGISSCVPKDIRLVSEESCLTNEEASKLSESTGIFERRIVGSDLCTSDLCVVAAEKLIAELEWDKNDIDILIFVTQTPDYILPATSPLLQHRLGLSTACFTLDISLGCSGYVYGLSTVASLMSLGNFKKGLLLVGDTISKVCSVNDKSTSPLFGDAGTATALVYDKSATPIYANMRSDGSGYKSIIINDGGYRNPATPESLIKKNIDDHIARNNTQLMLDGMDVFSFGITMAPKVVNELLESTQQAIDSYDYFIFHQANKMMNEKIRKKLKIDPEKVPYSLEKFGNTSCATIPLTITTSLSDILNTENRNLILCGFGVGLSWGAISLSMGPICLPKLIEI